MEHLLYKQNKSYYLILFSLLIFSCNKDIDIDEADNSNETVINPTALFLCKDGMADIYPCKGYDLMAHMPLSTFDATSGNDSWGWTDPISGNEYAIVGLDNGTAFINISDTENPVYLGKLPTADISSPWRDIKVYKDHAFIVADNTVGQDGHGMQVFDLKRLRNVANTPATFSADYRLTDFGRAHNIVINETSGYAYIVGGNSNIPYEGGPIFVNIQDPKNPFVEGGYAKSGYTHDAQVVTYSGPDTDYINREIFIGSNENEVVIVDVTDKSNPVKISSVTYPNVIYAHQGWLTQDMKYFILGDEVDEIANGNNTRAIIFDFTDLDNPLYYFQYLANNTASDHNGYIIGNTFYQASYRAGLRVIDISNIGGKSFSEIGYFDTYPDNNNPITDGTWNVYPFFESGNILLSDINLGLFIVRSNSL